MYVGWDEGILGSASSAPMSLGEKATLTIPAYVIFYWLLSLTTNVYHQRLWVRQPVSLRYRYTIPRPFHIHHHASSDARTLQYLCGSTSHARRFIRRSFNLVDATSNNTQLIFFPEVSPDSFLPIPDWSCKCPTRILVYTPHHSSQFFFNRRHLLTAILLDVACKRTYLCPAFCPAWNFQSFTHDAHFTLKYALFYQSGMLTQPQ